RTCAAALSRRGRCRWRRRRGGGAGDARRHRSCLRAPPRCADARGWPLGPPAPARARKLTQQLPRDTVSHARGLVGGFEVTSESALSGCPALRPPPAAVTHRHFGAGRSRFDALWASCAVRKVLTSRMFVAAQARIWASNSASELPSGV